MSASRQIIDNHIRDLAAALSDPHAGSLSEERFSEGVRDLVLELRERCSQPAVQERYAGYRSRSGSLSSYPLESDGFAASFDPLTEERDFYTCWNEHGIVVGKEIAAAPLRARTIERIHRLVSALSDERCDLSRPETYSEMPVDAAGVPLISRGFLEIYHDSSLAEIRQLVRLYLHYVLIWGDSQLWTSFDRYGVKLPEHSDSAALPLHVDQNPLAHSEFKTVQGVLALTDCPEERGTFLGVPGSKTLFSEYSRMAGRGEYVELNEQDEIAELLHAYAQPIPLRAGDLVSWDSRTTHANTANTSDQTRMVAYVAAGPEPLDSENGREARRAAYESGIGSNVRDALMHASKKPRFTDPARLAAVREPEQLTLLGRLLYGFESYDSLG